jgi:hypothetical protein
MVKEPRLPMLPLLFLLPMLPLELRLPPSSPM